MLILLIPLMKGVMGDALDAQTPMTKKIDIHTREKTTTKNKQLKSSLIIHIHSIAT